MILHFSFPKFCLILATKYLLLSLSRYTNFMRHQVDGNNLWAIKSIWKELMVGKGIFTSYRQYLYYKLLGTCKNNWLEFREIQRTTVRKSAILPKVFGWYVICEIRLYNKNLQKGLNPRMLPWGPILLPASIAHQLAFNLYKVSIVSDRRRFAYIPQCTVQKDFFRFFHHFSVIQS